MAPGLVAGLADFGGELVPVLDLARIGGELPEKTADWRMMVLKNGDFRALLMCESARDARTLDPEVQRSVPVVLSFPVVYGCYTDGGAVRLVLNVEELTVHYHESDAALLLPALAIAAEERLVRAPALQDVQEPALPAAAQNEAGVSREESIEPPVEPAQELPPPSAPSEPALPAEMVLGSLEPSAAETHPAEPAPAPPVPEIEQNLPSEPAPSLESASARASAMLSESAPAFESAPSSEPVLSSESAPSIGDEDILEPVHQASAPAPTPIPALTPVPALAPTPAVAPTPAATRSEPAGAGQTREAPADKPTPAHAKKSAPGHVRTGRRVLFAAAGAILLAACVIAALHFGVFRPRTTVPGAPAPAASETTPAATPAPAPTAAKQEITTGTDSSRSAETSYVVKKGDTLWDIAARFTGDAHNYRRLAATNGIADPNLISPGQVIKLPR